MKGTMKRTTRRVVSVVLALAMIFTSINYTPNTVSAEDAYNYTYQTFTGLVKDQIGYYVESANGVDGWTGAANIIDNPNEAMLRFTFANDGKEATVKIDDGEATATSNIAKPGGGLLDIFVAELPTNKDTVITYQKGEGTVVLHVIRKTEGV